MPRLIHFGEAPPAKALEDYSVPVVIPSDVGFKKDKSGMVKQLLAHVGASDDATEPSAFGRIGPGAVIFIDAGTFFGGLMYADGGKKSLEQTIVDQKNGLLDARRSVLDYMRGAINLYNAVTKGFSRVVLVLDEDAEKLPEHWKRHKRHERAVRTAERDRAEERAADRYDRATDGRGKAAHFGATHFDSRVSPAFAGDLPQCPDLVASDPTLAAAAAAMPLRTSLASVYPSDRMHGAYEDIWKSPKGRREIIAGVLARIIDAIRDGRMGSVHSLRVVGLDDIPLAEACRELNECQLEAACPGSCAWPSDGDDEDDADSHKIDNVLVFSGYDRKTASAEFSLGPTADLTAANSAPDAFRYHKFFAVEKERAVGLYGEADHGTLAMMRAAADNGMHWPRRGMSAYDWELARVPPFFWLYSADSDYLPLLLCWWLVSQKRADSNPDTALPPIAWFRSAQETVVTTSPAGPSPGARTIYTRKRVAKRSRFIVSYDIAARISNALGIEVPTPVWRRMACDSERKHFFSSASAYAQRIVLDAIVKIFLGGFCDYMPGLQGVGSVKFVKALFSASSGWKPSCETTFIDPAGTGIRARLVAEIERGRFETINAARSRMVDFVYTLLKTDRKNLSKSMGPFYGDSYETVDTNVSYAEKILFLTIHANIVKSSRSKVPPTVPEAAVRIKHAHAITDLAFAQILGDPDSAFSRLAKFYRSDGSIAYMRACSRVAYLKKYSSG